MENLTSIILDKEYDIVQKFKDRGPTDVDGNVRNV